MEGTVVNTKSTTKQSVMKWVKNLNSADLELSNFPLSYLFHELGTFKLTDRETRLEWEIILKEGDEIRLMYHKRQNGVYMIVMDNKIVKIGGTKTGMAGRISSYQCGHCIPERMDKHGNPYPGKMSVTNAYCYNTIYNYLNRGLEFSLWFYPIPELTTTRNVFGTTTTFSVQTYDEYEKSALNKFREITGNYPILSNNNHP